MNITKTEQNIGCEKKPYTPEAQYLIRFLKENKLLKKYYQAFNLKVNIDRRRKWFKNVNNNEITNLLAYVKLNKQQIYSNDSIVPNIINDSIDWAISNIMTNNNVKWSQYYNVLRNKNKLVQESIMALQNGEKISDRNNEKTYWV